MVVDFSGVSKYGKQRIGSLYVRGTFILGIDRTSDDLRNVGSCVSSVSATSCL